MTMSRSVVLGAPPWLSDRPEVIFVFRNWCTAREGATVVANSEEAEGQRPITKLLTGNRFDRWRSGSLSSLAGEIEVTFTLSSGRDIDMLWIGWSTLLLKWRADLYVDNPSAGGQAIATTDWRNPVVKGDLEYFDAALWGIEPTVERILELQASKDLLVAHRLQSVAHGINYVRFRIDATEGSNNVLPHVEAGAMGAGRVFQPVHGTLIGDHSMELAEQSVISRSADGGKGGVRRRVMRGFSFSLPNLSDDEAFGSAMVDWAIGQGQFGRVLCIPEPLKPRHFAAQAMIGTLERWERLGIEKDVGGMGPIVVQKSLSGVTVQEV